MSDPEVGGVIPTDPAEYAKFRKVESLRPDVLQSGDFKVTPSTTRPGLYDVEYTDPRTGRGFKDEGATLARIETAGFQPDAVEALKNGNAIEVRADGNGNDQLTVAASAPVPAPPDVGVAQPDAMTLPRFVGGGEINGTYMNCVVEETLAGPQTKFYTSEALAVKATSQGGEWENLKGMSDYSRNYEDPMDLKAMVAAADSMVLNETGKKPYTNYTGIPIDPQQLLTATPRSETPAVTNATYDPMEGAASRGLAPGGTGPG